MRRVLITGAAGFIGSVLQSELRARSPEALLLLIDRQAASETAGAQVLTGDLGDPALLAAAASFGPDTVFHLASVPGAASEADPALGRRVNLDASLNLLDVLAVLGTPPRVIYASSVAVYGPQGTTPVSDATPARPALTYGTHKVMVEFALADHTRRGELSGIALRLPGLVARPLGAGGFGSAFMSDLLWAIKAGEPYTCPVGPDATAWWLSVQAAARALLHAAGLTSTGTLLLPAQWCSVAEVVTALEERYGLGRANQVSWAPDPQTTATFGRYPPLETRRGDALGFTHDGTLQEMLRRSLDTLDCRDDQ